MLKWLSCGGRCVVSQGGFGVSVRPWHDGGLTQEERVC